MVESKQRRRGRERKGRYSKPRGGRGGSRRQEGEGRGMGWGQGRQEWRGDKEEEEGGGVTREFITELDEELSFISGRAADSDSGATFPPVVPITSVWSRQIHKSSFA